MHPIVLAITGQKMKNPTISVQINPTQLNVDVLGLTIKPHIDGTATTFQVICEMPVQSTPLNLIFAKTS